MLAHIKRLTILLAICLSGILINLDMSIVNLALPTIGESLHVKLSMLQWIVVAYLITASVAFILGGRLMDRHGARIISCLGMLTFLLGSLVSGFAPDGWIIAIGRGIQGIGFGLMVPAIIGISCSQFPVDKKAYAVSLIIVTAGITQCIGPTLGGFIIHWLSWRWIFFINIPVGVFYILIIYSLQRDVILEKNHDKISYGGIILYFLFSFLLIYGTNVLEIHPIDWLPFASAIIFALLFLLVSHRMERKKTASAIPYHLLKNKRYRGVMIIRSLSQMAFFGYLFFMPFWYEGIFGLTPFQGGLNLLYLSAGFGVVALFSAQITRKIGFHANLWIASCLVFASTLVVFFLVDEKQIIWANISIALAGISVAFVVTPSVTYALEAVPPEKMGQATGLFYSATVGIAVPLNVSFTGLIMSACLFVDIFAALRGHHIQLTDHQKTILPKVIGGSLHMQALKQFFTTDIIAIIKIGYKHAMRSAFNVIALFFSLTSIASLIVLHRLPDAEPQE
jgi:MFS family permease